ncbi:MAG: helix-turn-helix transcriptional regulator [Clostridia bacterium]|nr:helix-turn-helix transcriptional regulator [Clostridia bacterium]
MEKNTIGSFIAALRRAKGMTQRELAEQLFVSDKTVSRWERNESEPELSLIPMIADIFGVTSDELLRGKRIPALPVSERIEEEEDEETKQRLRRGNEKLFKKSLRKKRTRLKRLSFISLGIPLLGFLAQIICCFALETEKDYTMLGGFLSVGCIVIALVCQGIFSSFAIHNEEDEEYAALSVEHNGKAAAYSEKIFLAIFAVLGISLPLFAVNASARHDYDNYQNVILFGCVVLSSQLVALAHFVYTVWIEKKLLWNEKDKERQKRKIKNRALPCGGAFVLIAVGILLVTQIFDVFSFSKSKTFTDYAKLQTYMETEVEMSGYTNLEGDQWVPQLVYLREENAWLGLVDENGEVLLHCRWANREVRAVAVKRIGAEGFRAEVYTETAIRKGKALEHTLTVLLLCASVADAVTILVLTRKK